MPIFIEIRKDSINSFHPKTPNTCFSHALDSGIQGPIEEHWPPCQVPMASYGLVPDAFVPCLDPACLSLSQVYRSCGLNTVRVGREP
jgi:hypothetical protein